MGSLFVVGTPIGNLEDISGRALRTLREVALIAAEDTRYTRKLLAHYGIATPLVSYHAFNARARQSEMLHRLEQGDVALVTDAGTPGISDPGMTLVDAALDAGVIVQAIPGPSAMSAALSVSGLVDGPFVFLGFLPRKAGERQALLSRAVATGFALVLFESPQRLTGNLRELSVTCQGRRFAVVRELSKVHEEVVRDRFATGAEPDRFANARGEIVVVVEAGQPVQDEIDATAEIDRRLAAGDKPNGIARDLAALTGIPKSELYRLAIARAQSALTAADCSR